MGAAGPIRPGNGGGMMTRTAWYGLLALRWVVAFGVLLGFGLLADTRGWPYLTGEIVGVLVLGFAISLVAGPQTYESYKRWATKAAPESERGGRGKDVGQEGV